ncbi:MAG: nucleotidyltransferase domain-containing protein [Candidatus Margulisiibacteriota bacterium]
MKVQDRDAVIDRVRDVLMQHSLARAYVYGSYAHGHPTKDSDIDVLIVVKDHPSQVYKELSIQFWGEPISVEMVVYDETTFQEKLQRNQLVMSIVNKGVKII